MPLLEVTNLHTHFSTDAGVARAVDGISFHVDAGETLGLVGESGCGKTVSLLSIMGLIPVPPGRILPESSIRFNDEELVGAENARLRQIRGNEISMIFQEPMTSLNPVFTIGAQIEEALRLHRGLSRTVAREVGVSLLDEVGIAEAQSRFDEYPHQLSGGMQQRVMIAMALSCEPRLLIADEPTTALDVTIQAQILELLARLQKSRGMALLLITHDLGVVAEVCDKVAVMYAGKIVERGTVDEIFYEAEHPYTQGLLSSLPNLGEVGERLTSIPGVVPSPTALPLGCRFADRCPHAWDRCRAEEPSLEPVGDHGGSDRSSRCWLAVQDTGRQGGDS
jgi:oligopeptide/dipeptide ABC transporter ATP-binding protein